MSISVFDSDVALCNNEYVIIQDISNDRKHVIELPTLVNPPGKNDLRNNVDIEAHHTLTNIAFSKDGKYFAVCTNRKQLCLYERKNRKLLSNRVLTRAASKIRFCPNNDIVVADKTGDAYVYSTKDPKQEGTFVLGHLSMLLDVFVTADEKYILTTDRDEKIRVSLFPNSYNILAYCLGHTKFVTNISEVPHDKDIVVSAGGDGSMILWDYKCGKELLSIDISDKISKHDIDVFNQSLEAYNLDESIEILPVKHLVLSALDDATSLVGLSFWCSKTILFYNISGCSNTQLRVRYMNSINLEDEPLECLLRSTKFWTLTDSGIKVYEYRDDVFRVNDKLDSTIIHLNNSWDTLKHSRVKQNLFPILYKRKYDNVQDYLERKKARLTNATD